MFRKQKTIDACREAFYEAAERFGFSIRELGFGEDFAHVHMIVDIPSKFSVSLLFRSLTLYNIGSRLGGMV